MTRTISLITVTVGAALMLAVPAFADDWASDRRSDAVGYVNPDSADRAAALGQEQFALMLDAREESQTAKRDAQLASAPYPDAPSSRSPRLTVDRRRARADSSTFCRSALGFGIGVLLTLATLPGSPVHQGSPARTLSPGRRRSR